MDKDLKKQLCKDPNGLLTYEYIANHIDALDDVAMGELVDNMIMVDVSGQFLASASRYLYAINPEKYAMHISRLIGAVIDKDREHRYLQSLLIGIWGEDYETRAETLNVTDNNFRRIYKRVYSKGI
ncbi:MAG: hypothetical protein IJC40_06150 [Muribaculaceae bacterium]|nr:hypothetical protein [Muribaculaceae bacterium]